MRKMKNIIFLLILALFFIHPIGAQTNTVKSTAPSCFVFIKVHPNGELTVVERLKGFSSEVKRPLKNGRPYSSTAHFVQDPFIEVVKATADGKPVNPAIHFDQNEPRFITLLAPDNGQDYHEYTLTYRVKDSILFEPDADKLVWDIWGALPGEGLHLSGVIELPSGATISKQWARLGHETVGHRPVKQWINDKGAALFRGEQPLGEREHFVISVEWNKGIVKSDGSEKKILIVKCVMWGLFFLLLLLCGGLWFKYGKDPHPKASTPLFYPPTGSNGKVLSPAAVAYIRKAAFLPSSGFAGLLLNLAVQKMLNLTGSGSKKDPYVLQTSNEILQRVEEENANEEALKQDTPIQESGKENSRTIRRIWQEMLQRACGFDAAERHCLQMLFPRVQDPDSPENKGMTPIGNQSAALSENTQNEGEQAALLPPDPVRIDGSYSWLLAEARATAYTALAKQYRGTWNLRAGLVIFLFMACYFSVTLVQALLWFLYGGGNIAVTLAIIATVGGLCLITYYCIRFVERIWVKWQEMGSVNLALFGLYILLLPIILIYDLILDKSMADFFLYEFMHLWQIVRIILWLGLMVYLLILTRKPKEVLITPLKITGFLLLFFIVGGLIFYTNRFTGSANLAFFGAMLLPLCFMPFMKQPAKKATQLLADIEGFAMYIGAAEAQRLNFINPPERTPEEFHRIMPYAVALGLEKAWGAQFADIFKEMRFHGSSLNILAEYEHRMKGE